MGIRKTSARGIWTKLTASFVFGLLIFLSHAAQKDARAKQASDEDYHDEGHSKPLRKLRHLYHNQENKPDGHTQAQ